MDWKQDSWQRGVAEKPRFIVMGNKVGTPFYDYEYAIAWQVLLFENGVFSIIRDISNYNWNLNPEGYKFHILNS
jgi:hypothetical protein